jgi:hypothetical protein
MMVLSLFVQTCVTFLDDLICHVRRFCEEEACNCSKIEINTLNPEFPKEDANFQGQLPQKDPHFCGTYYCSVIASADKAGGLWDVGVEV